MVASRSTDDYDWTESTDSASKWRGARNKWTRGDLIMNCSARQTSEKENKWSDNTFCDLTSFSVQKKKATPLSYNDLYWNFSLSNFNFSFSLTTFPRPLMLTGPIIVPSLALVWHPETNQKPMKQTKTKWKCEVTKSEEIYIRETSSVHCAVFFLSLGCSDQMSSMSKSSSPATADGSGFFTSTTACLMEVVLARSSYSICKSGTH